MFNFIAEFLNDMPKDTLKNDSFRYFNYGGKFICVQNFKDILVYSKEEIVLKLKSGEISLIGKEMTIKELSDNYIVISGVIKNVEVNGVEDD